MQAEQTVAGEVVVEVEFNQQQDVILKQVREEGSHGMSDEEVIRNVLRDYLRLAKLL